ncbi:hypothetical protein S83_047890, partial [Arachis hypogaea]
NLVSEDCSPSFSVRHHFLFNARLFPILKFFIFLLFNRLLTCFISKSCLKLKVLDGNQHRRSSYFQHLLKASRDIKLLQSANLEELVSSCLLVIKGDRPKQNVHLFRE